METKSQIGTKHNKHTSYFFFGVDCKTSPFTFFAGHSRLNRGKCRKGLNGGSSKENGVEGRSRKLQHALAQKTIIITTVIKTER